MRLLGRLRRARKAPLAVAGILATPLFFVALMAFALLLDEPTSTVNRRGVEILGDPSRSTVWTVYVLSLAVSGGLVLVGVVALLVPRRVAVFLPCLVAIGVSVVLVLPLQSWEAEHTARYPNGVDLIARAEPDDLILRGEWEENARRTAQQIGFWTIVMASAAMALTFALRFRRRRGPVPPAPPAPPEVAGEPQVVPRTRLP